MKTDTSLQSLEARMLSAELRGDEQTWRQLHAVDQREEDAWSEVMPTALTLAAVRRFGQADLRLITVFVRAFRAREPHSAFSAADLEAVLRGVLGEELLFASVSSAEAGELMHALLFALVDELCLSDEQADGLLAAAEKQVAADNQAVDVPTGAPDGPVLPDSMRRRAGQPYLTDDMDIRPPGKDGQNSKPGGRGRLFGSAKRAKPSTVAGRFISASMLRRSEERQRWSALLNESGTDDLTRLTRTVFTIAVQRHFNPGVHLREISDLAAATQEAFYPELDLMATEFLVRAALGENVPETGLPVRDEILTRTLVLGTLADWWKRDQSAINAMIVQAEAELADTGESLIAVAGS